jgi:hypothetical protein
LQDNGEIGDANGSVSVVLNEGVWLRPTHFDESLTEGGISLDVVLRAPSLAMAAEDMKNFIVWEIDRTGPLCLGKGSFFRTKMWAPALLRPFDSL